jgi:hypothetical protein
VGLAGLKIDLDPLPLAVAAFEGPEEEAEGPSGATFSSQVKREGEGRLPPPDPLPPPCFTSLRACAPKLIRRANEGELGGFGWAFVASSSITAGSSPKLFLNSGEPVLDEVDTLAWRCFANALKGDCSGLTPRRPRPLVEVDTDAPRLWVGRGRLAETEVEGGLVEEDMEGREVNNSAKDERRR